MYYKTPEPKMIQKIIFCLKICLFITLAVIFEELILYNKLMVITSIQFAPLLAYILLILFFKDMSVPIVVDFNKVIIVKSILAIIIPVLIMAIAYLSIKIIGINIVFDSMDKNWLLLYPMLLAQLLGAIGEEIGWRSFLQTTLEKKMPVLLSSIIVGTIWGLWHIPVHYIFGITAMVLFISITIMFSIIMSIILKNTKNNIYVSTLLHTSMNVFIFVLFNPNAITRETISTIAIVMLIMVAIMIPINREYLLKQKNGT
jgi:membrane protease YdiL (CAAX protease family)